MRTRRDGVTLVEVIVAILLFSTGALGLAATSAVITRQMTMTLLRSRSANLARERSEKAHASNCAGVSSGQETRDGIRSSWTVTTGGAVMIDQQLERSSTSSTRTDRFLSAAPCD
jgi:prepilin-type N-terminal cleavage/methylation domain-containing protein